VAYCDADDVVSPVWLRSLVSVLGFHEIATGPRDMTLLNPPALYAWRREPTDGPARWLGYLDEVSASNLAVRREAFDLVDGFDGSLRPAAEDIDFAWRIQLSGGTAGFSSEAVVHYRLRRGWAYFSRHLLYGEANVRQYARFGGLGMPRRPWRGALRLIGLLLSAPWALRPSFRYRWLTSAGISVGHVVGSLRHRVWYL
jgi:GT2 family glycosyltransferase